jgi:hypothetical protein
MNLQNLKSLLSDKGCKVIYVKSLAPNDNSKNQVYLGGSFDLLNIFPTSEIKAEAAGDWKRQRFKANTQFYWITDEGNMAFAPESQFILYPKYPEVRFSGFLKKCSEAPSNLMASRLSGRLLFFAITSERNVLGYVASPESEIAREFHNLENLEAKGVFKVIEIVSSQDNKSKLIKEFQRIVSLGWIESKRLGADGQILPCLAPNCGGYTLEAELGVTPNGYSEPDFLGWEVKQFNAKSFDKYKNEVITLMTPEPTQGFYVNEGVEAFVRKYGYADKLGRPDRLNFGGIHKAGVVHHETKLKLELIGFDSSINKIKDVNGRIALLDLNDNEAASWSFASLLKHWNRKHNQACYLASQNKKEPVLQYRFGNNLILGSGTDFILFLKQMSAGNIYYDPGIKLENISTKPQTKRRSQFRIKSGFLQDLYYSSEIVDLA